MPVIYALLFLTLVVSSVESFAAPTATTTLETSPLDGEDDAELGSIKTSDFPKRKAFLAQVSLGYQAGNYLESDEQTQSPFLLLRLSSIKKGPLPMWDYEVSLTDQKFMGIGVGRRWYFAPESRFVPYSRLGANAYLETSEGLAGLIEVRRWRAHAGVGAGDTFTGEIGTGLAVTGPDLYAQIGFNIQF